MIGDGSIPNTPDLKLFNLAEAKAQVSSEKTREIANTMGMLDLGVKSIDWIGSLPPEHQPTAYAQFKQHMTGLSPQMASYIPDIKDPAELPTVLSNLKWAGLEGLKRAHAMLENKKVQQEIDLKPKEFALKERENDLKHEENRTRLYETARAHDIAHEDRIAGQENLKAIAGMRIEATNERSNKPKFTAEQKAALAEFSKDPKNSMKVDADGEVLPEYQAEAFREYASKKSGASETGRREAKLKLSEADEKLAEEVANNNLSPSQLSKRTDNYNAVLAKAFSLNPKLNAKLSDAQKQLMGNAAYRQKGQILEVVPDLVKSVVSAGKKLQYNKAQLIGKGEKWWNGQTNDPDYVEYMTQRNDILMTLSGVMRGTSATDQATKLEDEAMHPTLDPAALDGWMRGQLKAAEPRIRQYEKSVGGIDRPLPLYGNANEVKAAYKEGKITKEEARNLLKNDYASELK